MTQSTDKLEWPIDQPRTRSPQRSRFDIHGSRSFAGNLGELGHQLRLLKAKNVRYSSNLPLNTKGLPTYNRRPADAGFAVYFSRDGIDMVLACDWWDKVADNVWSIAKHIEALRGQERWGVGSLSQALAGYRLPPAAPELPELQWWDVLEVSPDATIEQIRVAYRAKAKQAHPDNREGFGDFIQITKAYNAAMEARGQRSEITTR